MAYLLLLFSKHFNSLIGKNVKSLFKDIFSYRKEPLKIMVWFVNLPLTILFVLINFIVFITSVWTYAIIFIFNVIYIKILKKKNLKTIFFKIILRYFF